MESLLYLEKHLFLIGINETYTYLAHWAFYMVKRSADNFVCSMHSGFKEINLPDCKKAYNALFTYLITDVAKLHREIAN